jgi:hypothetical protein
MHPSSGAQEKRILVLYIQLDLNKTYVVNFVDIGTKANITVRRFDKIDIVTEVR